MAALEFEVADLKMSTPDEQGCCFQVKPGGRLEARAMPLKILISAAWDVDWEHADEKLLSETGSISPRSRVS